MKFGACTRLWQAEAAHDGRLSGAERASFEGHAATCMACAFERRLLAKIRDQAQGLSVDSPSELERRRLRHRILRRAEAVITGHEPRIGRLWPGVAVAGSAALFVIGVGLAALVGGKSHLGSSPAPLLTQGLGRPGLGMLPAALTAASEPPTQVVERASNAARTRVAQAPARANCASRRRAAPRPSRVAAPGQNAGGRREQIPSPNSFMAQHRWLAPEERRGSLAEPTTPKERSVSDAATRSGTAYARAVRLFLQGDYASAEKLFSDFERSFRADARVEDAAFLRALCRQRLGDPAGAARGAGEYLERYPAGFRRKEAAAILVNH